MTSYRLCGTMVRRTGHWMLANALVCGLPVQSGYSVAFDVLW